MGNGQSYTLNTQQDMTPKHNLNNSQIVDYHLLNKTHAD